MTFPRLHLSAAALALIVYLLPCSLRAQTSAVTFVVNSTNDRPDSAPGDGKCSTGSLTAAGAPECTLRAAVDESKSGAASGYIIQVPAGTYNMTATEVSCYYWDAPNQKVTLCPGNNVTIKGAGAASTILDFGLQSRGFVILQANTVSISGLTIQNATASNDNPYGGGGGGIINLGTLTLGKCTFFNDVSGNNGGAAVYTTGTLNVAGCTFQNNGQEAIRVNDGTAVIDSSTFTSTLSGSGAIYANGGTTSISNSTFTANQTTHVLYLPASATVTNTTIAGNNSYGNVVDFTYSAATLNNDTITGNTIGNGFTIGVGFGFGGARPAVAIANTIVSNNQTQYLDCTGPIIDQGHNLFGTMGYGCSLSDPTSKSGIGDPKLSALEVDGSSVATMTPLAGSPAIGGGSTATPGGNATGACTALDQNCLPRGVGSTCSVGAAEPLKGFQVNRFTPSAGGTGGNITMVVTGSGFDSATTVALRRSGQADIAAQVQLPSVDATSLTAGFSLVGAALGTYDVVVTSSTASVTLPGAFTVANPTPNTVQSFLSGPNVLRPGRPGTYVLTYSNLGNNDAYLVPLFLGLPNGYTGGIKGLQTPPTNAQQVLTDYSASSLAMVPATQPATVNVPLLLPVVPAGSQNVLTFTVVASGNEGDKFFVNQQVGVPLTINLDTGIASTTAINAAVSGAVLDATQNLGVKPTAAAQTAMASYANTQLEAIVAAGETALLQSNGAAPIVYSIPQLLDDIGAYGAAYTPPAGGVVVTRPFYLPSLFHAPVPPNCDETPMAPGSSCGAPFAPVPGHSPYNYCAGNALLQLAANGYNDCPPNSPSGGGGGTVVGSVDPNLKSGPVGVGVGHYTQAATTFPYLIEFENEATASAPAQTVSVTDTLDTTKLDLSTFQFGPISFGSVPFVLNPPSGVTSFQGSVDLRPVDNIIVDVTASLNKSTGVVTWNFISLDPATMQLTTDPTAGFLPPDTTPPAGIGHVAFTINPLSSVADASTICNTATVVFDTNSPINTAQYCNTKDISPPASMVQPLASTQSTTTFAVTWAGADSGSGVGSYTIYVSDNGGAFTAWQSATTATSAQYTGVNGHTYSFYSIATDLVGNVEAAKTVGEASTTVTIVAAASLSPASVPFGPVAIGSSVGATVTVTSTGSVPLSVTGVTLSDTVNFAQTNTCSSTLSTGKTCTVTVVFSPTASASVTGPTNATLSLLSNAATAPSPVTLTGTAFSLTPYVFVTNSGGSVSSLFSNGSVQSSAISGGGIGAAVDRNGLVFSITADGTGVSTFSDSGTLVNTTSGVLKAASALAIDGGDQLWIASSGSVSVGQILGSGQTSIADPTLEKPSGVAIDLSGNVWISDSQSNTVHEIVGGGLPTQPLATAVTNKTPGTEPQ